MSDTLLLNANYEPISVLPMSVISWQHAIKLMFLDKVYMIEEYDDWIIHSAHMHMKVPAICVTKGYFNSKKHVHFNRRNLYLRDLYTCQYCEEIFGTKDLTIDHVKPRVHGGKHSWTNCVTACRPCNHKKGDKLWKPIKKPFEPNYYQLVNTHKKVPIHVKHPSWAQYLMLPDAMAA